jgi:predicted transcriptional regulator YheO
MNSVNGEQEFLKSLIKGIAKEFGENCEVVLHDLKDRPYDGTIIAIENGHVTGRNVGDCGTNLGLEVLRGTDQQGDRYNYISQTKEGKILRSTSIYIRDENKTIIGSICINFDVTNFIMAENVLNSLTHHSINDKKGENRQEVNEFFTNNVNHLLQLMIQESINYVGKPVVMMTKEDKMKGVAYLDRKGALLIKKSGDRIGKFYDISKYTLYNYLEEIRTQPDFEVTV